MGSDPSSDQAIPRRTFLRLVGVATTASSLGALVACAGGDSVPITLEVPLDSLPVGGRQRLVLGEMPIELTRSDEGITVRSLWCTHTGCEVKWLEDQNVYFCPCHEGRFSSEGKPLAGPPPRPFRQIPAVVAGSTILIGAESPSNEG